MTGYYDDRLSAERLRRAYEIAPPRVRQYLDAEVEHVISRMRPGDRVLELGCGYGRVLRVLAEHAGTAVGIDTSMSSLRLGRGSLPGVSLLCMDALRLGFGDRSFDCVVCIQNGISAFKVEPRALLREAVRVTREGGIALFSSYSSKFWKYRLKWFELQSEAGLLGDIDRERTGDGVIVCKDGFEASTLDEGRFRTLTAGLDVDTRIVEVDASSLFCEMARRPGTSG